MAITPNFDWGAIDNILDDATEKMQKDIVRILRFVGEKVIREARMNKTYKDQTGNLRNSTGYVIVMNGRVVYQDFRQSVQGSNVPSKRKNEGMRAGLRFALEKARQYPDIALVVVAGMNYASYVESQGYNVLTSAEQLAKTEVPRMLQMLVE